GANPLFCQRVADACQLPVVAGPVEAACWGNILTQARALGVAGGSLAEMRSLVRQAVRLVEYRPSGPDPPWERSGAANKLATTRPPGRVTRAASRSAFLGSPANWNALTPVTASNAASPKGRNSMSPRR